MENYAKKLAINNKISKKSSISTFPIKDLKNNYSKIEKSYQILNESIANNVPIPPSGEWLLDNFYLIEEQVNTLKKELTEKQYRKLPSVDGKSRIYVIAEEIVNYTDGLLNESIIVDFIRAYQTKKAIFMDELWVFPVMLRIALINYIGKVSEKINITQKQKFKVESLFERIIENKSINEQKFHKYKGFEINNEATAYVEYLIYLLKKKGKEGSKYLDILEEEIFKVGTTSNEIIRVEHYDMALQRVSISNSITSIRNISRINFLDIFEKINNIDYILEKDEYYTKQNFETRNMYRNKLKSIAIKTKLSEIYVANKLIQISESTKKHIGEFLIGNEEEKFLRYLGYKKRLKIKTNGEKLYIYLFCIYIPTIILSILISPKYLIFLLIPVSEIFVTLTNKIITKILKPRIIPELESFSDDIGTFVIVPTLLNSSERVKKMIKNLEVYYLGNKMKNIYFALLGDCSETNSESMPYDEEIIKTGIDETNKLNNKYGEKIFFFLYRNRIYNEKQEKWLGYERKRGMICEFNDFLLNKNQGTFRVNTIDIDCNNIKYVITLDADTELVLESAKRLVGMMEHPLNKPLIKDGIVVNGYGLIQPKVGISIEGSTASLFSKIFAGSGGIDVYSTADSNVYQDVFGEAIFTGKGIYNVKVFEEVLKNKIPENTVLSHDLLEGSFIRCGLASNVELIDGFPPRVNSYMLRLHRWTRGDFQISNWLFKGPLNKLSKYKIFDNLRRAVMPIFLLSLLLMGYFYLPMLIIFFPFVLDLLDKILNIGLINGGDKTKNYIPIINGLKGSLYRCFFELMFLPYKAILLLDAIIVTIYRMNISHKHLLSWVTAADSEKILGKDLKSFLNEMIISPLIGFLLILLSSVFNFNIIFSYILFLIWTISPFLSFSISSTDENNSKIKILDEEKSDLLDICRRTWNYFDEYMNKENNFLPPDNWDENRKVVVVPRTSATNIGLGLLSIISASDLKFISKDEAIGKIKNTINTINKLEKWNGHIYNWYNIKNLAPLEPRFVSTVDSGNFVGYLYVVKNFLESLSENYLADEVSKIIEATDFSFLYDDSKNLFSIGFDYNEKKLIDSYYDLLASESRLASFIAIAKKDIPYKHWFSLSRTLTSMDRYKGLISWAGTMFEYFMPLIVMKDYKYTLMDETYEFCIYSQKKYAKKLKIPWGISESAFNLQDLNYNYQYKAFGIPWLGVKRGLKEEVVVSPYSSILAVSKDFKNVYKNIEELKKENAYGEYGFYDSIDYTPSRVKANEKKSVVKTYMAHHQGLILLSINNFLNDNIMQKRFESNSEIKAFDILLQERVPQNIVFTKEKKEKIKTLKYKDYEDYSERLINNNETNVNILSNDDYTMLINTKGQGYSSYKNILLTRYKEDNIQSNFIYIKDVNNNKSWSNTLFPLYNIKPDLYTVSFSPAICKFFRSDNMIDTITKIVISPEDNVEIRKVKIKNNRDEEVILDVITYLELALTEKQNDIVHPAFNNLFMYAEKYKNACIVEKRSRKKEDEKKYFMNYIYSLNVSEDFELELDKSKIIGRNRSIYDPSIIEHDKKYTNEAIVTPNMAISYKSNIKLNKNDEVVLNVIYAFGDSKEELIKLYDKYSKQDNVNRVFDLAVSRSLVENRFLGFKGIEIEKYNNLLSKIIEGTNRCGYEKYILNNNLKQKDLWKFGISGDLPMVLVKIKRVNESEIIGELITFIEYLYRKNIFVDLIILNEEANSYEEYVKDKIYEIISVKNANYLVNINGGIHIIRGIQISKDEINLLYACSNIIIDAHFGSLEDFLYENG